MWGYLAWKAGTAVFWTMSMKSPGQSWKRRVTGLALAAGALWVAPCVPQAASTGVPNVAARAVVSMLRRVAGSMGVAFLRVLRGQRCLGLSTRAGAHVVHKLSGVTIQVFATAAAANGRAHLVGDVAAVAGIT